VPEIAAALAPAVEACAGARVLIGHSLGGAVALELARTRPGLAEGLVLVATGARIPVPDEVMAQVRTDFAAARDRLVRRSFAGPAGPARERLRRTLDACGQEVLVADYAACAGFDLRGALGEVDVPALVIAAGEDTLTPPWLAEELARELPLATMALVPGAGHQVIVEGAEPVDLLIAAFLARLELSLDEA
jgi:3-oxoadipate enol-lactonase